jgi:hypothetical protein
MKAEISQLGLYRERQFTGVYQQQGRMLLDGDWNEQCDILRELTTGVSAQAIGTGVPRHGGLLERPVAAEPVLTLRNEGGLVAAAGMIGKVLRRSTESAANIYRNQRDLPERVRALLPEGDEVPPIVPRAVEGQVAVGPTQLLLRDPPEKPLLYVDIWDRTVTAFETEFGPAGDLIDPALHGADTCFRQQRLVQIKTATLDDLAKDGDPCLPAFNAERIPTKGNAIFEARLTPAGDAPDPCDPCGQQVSIARSVTNHLFRLEVHSVTFEKRKPVRVVLKWSRDNGARELRLAELEAMSGAPDHSYEYFSDATERLLGMPSDDWVDEEFLRGVLDPSDPDTVSGALPRVREWDGWCALSNEGGTWGAQGSYRGTRFGPDMRTAPGRGITLALAGETLKLDLDSGFSFSLDFAGKSFLPGDYWLALVRARAPADRRVRVISPTPIGVEHRYCVLGVATEKETVVGFEKLSAHDLRRLQHPSLTCLDAPDVGYATDCPSGLFDASHDTVKKALDRVCGIGAEHVAFQQPCKTSIFGQPGADKIRTVADALKLLCTVSAEQIGFTPECDYLKKKEAADVAAALNALCAQPADTIPFTPECDYLKKEKATNVAAALNALCRQSASQDLPVLKGINWKNDAPLPLSALRNGLTVAFSESIAAGVVSSDVFVVTWEIPLALGSTGADARLPDFLTPQIMIGNVKATEQDATFVPNLVTTNDVFKRLFGSLGQLPRPDFAGIRCRVRLIGRAIFDKAGKRPLDGYVPMAPVAEAAGQRIDLNFKSPGLGQPSDFESWFYVVEG